MARYQSDELDYMADDYGMTDFEDDAGNENHNRRMLDADSHYEDESDVHRATDTTAIQARRGKDIQGIPWERMNFTRAKYRENRLQQYKNYENVPRHRHYLDKECKHFEKGCNFYDFGYNTRSVKSTVVHFQIIVRARTDFLTR